MQSKTNLSPSAGVEWHRRKTTKDSTACLLCDILILTFLCACLKRSVFVLMEK
jgi:hypothetical protein